MPSLYAVIVSVSKYPNPAHCLPGCATDFETIQALLEQQARTNGLDYHPLMLNDELATRQAIIDSFDHFKQANAVDYCVFYYSGHGSYVPTSDIFYNNSSGRNESLVCYDSRTVGGKDLMDKELAFLAHRSMHEKRPNFISILDCCHSGSAFRFTADQTTNAVRTRQTPPAGFVPIEDYLGYDSYLEINGKKQAPIYPGVHLAACQPHELSQECNINGLPQGVFTYGLSRELSLAAPNLSVDELMRRVNFRVNTINPKQFPYLERDKGVGISKGQALFSTVSNESKNAFSYRFQIGFRAGKWFVNAGAQQGIQPGSAEQESCFIEADGSIWTVTNVEPHRSEVYTTDKAVDKQQIYSARLKENGSPAFHVALDAELPEHWKQSLKAVATSQFPQIKLQENATAAYRVEAFTDHLVLVREGEGYPLFERVEMFKGEFGLQSAAIFLERLSHIAAWESVLTLNNPSSKIEEQDIDIEVIIDDGSPEQLVVKDFDEATPLHYHRDNNGEEIEPCYQVKITNTSVHTYWISAIQASSDFAISNEILSTPIELAPNNSYFLGGKSIDGEDLSWQEAFIDDAYQSWSVTEITDYLRIFVSKSHKLNTDSFNQHALPLDNKTPSREATKDKGSRPARSRQSLDDWMVKGLAFRIIRPLDSVPISSDYDCQLAGLKVAAAPGGFKANAKLSTLKTTNRSLTQPLPAAFAAGSLLSFNHLTGERSFSEALNVLELSEIEERDAISADKPLCIQTNLQLASNETVVPFAYDPICKAYYPLGYLNNDGNILIQDIPQEVATERSLGGSVKIFFQKIVGSKLGVKSDYPLLRRVEENDQQTIVYTNDSIEAIKDKIASTSVQSVAVFIHGIIGDTTTSTQLLQLIAKERGTTFNDQYQVVLTFDYENLGTNIEDTAKDFLKKLEALGFREHGKTLHLFAHSMGGLVSRWMIEKEGGDQFVNHLYTFGTPHGGSPWSNVAEMLTTAVTYAINGITVSNFWMLPLLGVSKLWKASQTTLEEMKPKGDFIKRLNDGATAPIPYTLITGDTQLIQSQDPERSKNFLKRLVYRFRHQPHYALLDLTLFKSPNDIAVSVESQQMVRGGLVNKPNPIPCDHLSYFNNPDCVALMNKLLK